MSEDHLSQVAPDMLEALKEVLANGLIYWEPNTARGAAAKADMIARLQRLIERASGGAI